MPNISFGERLKRARIRNAMSQAELAEKIRVSQATVSNWEIGKAAPLKEQKVELARVLGGFSADSTPTREEFEAQGPTALSSWLSRERAGRGLSVSELAEKAGISAPAVYNIERGRILNPRVETMRKLERALGAEIPKEAKEEVKEEAKIEGLGELVDFDPHNEEDFPAAPGIYVLYDISERPIYVGQGADIRSRLRDHKEKFWYRHPIVDTASFVKIEEQSRRRKVETLLIRFLESNAVINKQNVERT